MMVLGGRLEKAVALVGGGCLWMRARYVRCGIRQTPRGGAGVSTLTPANMLSTSIYVPHLQKRHLRESVTQWGGGGGVLGGGGGRGGRGAPGVAVGRRTWGGGGGGGGGRFGGGDGRSSSVPPPLSHAEEDLQRLRRLVLQEEDGHALRFAYCYVFRHAGVYMGW